MVKNVGHYHMSEMLKDIRLTERLVNCLSFFKYLDIKSDIIMS